MKKLITNALLLSLALALKLHAGEVTSGSTEVNGQSTVIYLIRHAEKDLTTKQDPDLTDRGRRRAEAWAKLFKHTDLAAVYSTDTKRTINTATPSSKYQNKSITLYHPKELDLEKLLMRHTGENILIVGHSNTTARLSNRLLQQEKFEDMSEDDYDSLFIVTLQGGSAHAQRLNVGLAK